MSSYISRYLLWSVTAALLAASSAATYAQANGGTIGEVQNLDQILKSVDGALPPIIGNSNTELARHLLAPPLAPPLSQTFSLKTAVAAIFKRSTPAFAPNCSRAGTAVNEPDQGDCDASIGTPEGGGVFTQLSFSKNLGVGNIRFVSRPAFNPNFVPGDLKPIAISDGLALDQAVSFLSGNFGLSKNEFPLPPAGVPNASPFVSNLAVGGADDKGNQIAPVVIQKVVQIPRGFLLNLRDPASGQVVPFVPAPGVAKVLIDTSGIVGALVENWQELRVDPTLNPANAKTRSQLMSEIAQDLQADGGARIANVSAHIVYSSDWRGSFGYLVPAVQVYVAPATGELNVDQLGLIEKQNIGTAGIVREYALIARPDFTVPGR
jgi:hypothetical protein